MPKEQVLAQAWNQEAKNSLDIKVMPQADFQDHESPAMPIDVQLYAKRITHN